MDFFKLFWMMLFDERGEDNPAGDNGGAPADGGQGAADAGGDDIGGDGGQAGADDGGAPATPKYGDFGDTPKTQEEALALLDKIYGEHTKIAPEYKNLTTKAGLTEKNLANTRKALQAVGLRAVQDEDGSIRLEALEPAKKQERQKRFTDTHKTQLASFFKTSKDADDFLGILSHYVNDQFDEGYDTRESKVSERRRAINAWNSASGEANSLMMDYFPTLDAKWDDNEKPTNANFNEPFWNRATQIWESEIAPDGIPYKRKPEGELLAALKAAKELKIPMQQLVAAKKEGAAQGKAEKKILGPVDGKNKGKAAGGKLEKAEYLKLSPEDQKKHDAEQQGLKV